MKDDTTDGPSSVDMTLFVSLGCVGAFLFLIVGFAVLFYRTYCEYRNFVKTTVHEYSEDEERTIGSSAEVEEISLQRPATVLDSRMHKFFNGLRTLKLVEKQKHQSSTDERTDYQIPTYSPLSIVDRSGITEDVSRPPRKVYELKDLLDMGSSTRLEFLMELATNEKFVLSEVMLPQVPILNSSPEDIINKDLLEIANELRTNSDLEIQVLRFLAHSVGEHLSPRIFFTSYYAIITILESETIMLKLIGFPKSVRICIAEAIIKYCSACWDYCNSTQAGAFTNLPTTIPAADRLCQITIRLLSLNVISKTIKDMLDHFSKPMTAAIINVFNVEKKKLYLSQDSIHYLNRVEQQNTDRNLSRSRSWAGSTHTRASLPGSLLKRSSSTQAHLLQTS